MATTFCVSLVPCDLTYFVLDQTKKQLLPFFPPLRWNGQPPGPGWPPTPWDGRRPCREGPGAGVHHRQQEHLSRGQERSDSWRTPTRYSTPRSVRSSLLLFSLKMRTSGVRAVSPTQSGPPPSHGWSHSFFVPLSLFLPVCSRLPTVPPVGSSRRTLSP